MRLFPATVQAHRSVHILPRHLREKIYYVLRVAYLLALRFQHWTQATLHPAHIACGQLPELSFRLTWF